MSTTALAALNDEELRARLGVSKARVTAIFRPLIDALAEVPAGSTITPAILATKVGCTPTQIVDALTTIAVEDYSVFDKTTEYLPSSAAMIQLLERKLGPIRSD